MPGGQNSSSAVEDGAAPGRVAHDRATRRHERAITRRGSSSIGTGSPARRAWKPACCAPPGARQLPDASDSGSYRLAALAPSPPARGSRQRGSARRRSARIAAQPIVVVYDRYGDHAGSAVREHRVRQQERWRREGRWVEHGEEEADEDAQPEPGRGTASGLPAWAVPECRRYPMPRSVTR